MSSILKTYYLKLEQYSAQIFLWVFFLVRIPPFYFFPVIRSSLFTTHTLARLLIGILFLVVLYRQLSENKQGRSIPIVAFLFMGYLLFQSLSVVGVVNEIAFLERYKDVVFPGLFLFVLLNIQAPNFEAFFKIFLYSLTINFFLQMTAFVAPGFFESFGKLFIYDKHFELVMINIERFRIFIETYDEIFLPILFGWWVNRRKSTNSRTVLMIALVLSMIAIPSFLSNFRSRILMLGVGGLGSILYFGKGHLFKALNTILVVSLVGLVSLSIVFRIFGFSIVDRFLLTDENEDVDTITLRVNTMFSSLDMMKENMLFGVGLGNYYEHMSAANKSWILVFSKVWKESKIAATNPHNIFAQQAAETGFLGLSFYVFMIGCFGVSDIKKLLSKSNDSEVKSYIFSFWTLFSFALFNPATTLSYNVLFWVLRGLIK